MKTRRSLLAFLFSVMTSTVAVGAMLTACGGEGSTPPNLEGTPCGGWSLYGDCTVDGTYYCDFDGGEGGNAPWLPVPHAAGPNGLLAEPLQVMFSLGPRSRIAQHARANP
jgi:hypothetical protein